MLRPMRPADVPAAERLSSASFHELDIRVRRVSEPEPSRRTGSRSRRWEERTRHLLDTDPGGCWVAEDESGMVGMVTSLNRELMWILATYAVRPSRQGSGVGTQLLALASHHGRGTLRAMLASSNDPRAVRRYRLAGFDLHPQMYLTGTLDRSAIPVVDPVHDKVREGSATDTELMDSLDRRTRGAAHGPDHTLLLREWRVLVSDTSTGSGYAYVDQGGSLCLLAASNRRTATRLLWSVLADGPPTPSVFHLTAANQWALDVAVAARLEIHQEGYLGVRGMRPPSPYVHHGALL